MIKRVLPLFFALTLFVTKISRSDEGMWIPILLKSLNEAEMKQMGFKLTAEDIYSVNKSSMKDGVVLFGGGCTGELISSQGLLLTNHHCGYSRIQSHSTIEHNYLKDGFWAQSHEEELPNPGLSVTFLVRMEDVTNKVLENVKNDMPEKQRKEMINDKISQIVAKLEEESHYKAYIRPFFYGNAYYLFVTETFTDIRLVGAPPSSIGKFGGDTDNWMWPRHTGDFSMFRIYANEKNEPADYSPSNVPYKSKYHFKISLKGIKPGDFTFVFGYPGRTEEYITSHAVKTLTEERNPVKIQLRQERLDIYEEFMNMSEENRIKYAAKQAGVANYWKKMIGESRGIEKTGAINDKQEFENRFLSWASDNSAGAEKYGQLIPAFDELYKEYSPILLSFDYFVEAGHSVDVLRYAFGFNSFITKLKAEKADDKDFEKFAKVNEGHFKNFNAPLEKKMFVALLQYYYDSLDSKHHPKEFKFVRDKYDGDFSKYADDIFSKSIYMSQQKMDKLLNSKKQTIYKKLEEDLLYKLASSIYGNYIMNIKPTMDKYEGKLDSLYRIYMKGMMEMELGKRFYPDANSTLRVAYGKVDGYEPRDGVHYKYYTSLEGIIEKDDPAVYDYKVDKKLKELYAAKDYDRYADADGSMHVAFIATNHTTGGNSGSPVLNANGELIGVNFDRCWEGTMSDIVYDPDLCRNITLDIRYCLFIIDKFANARHLVEEMTIVE
jgi:hypothetical protein